MKRREAIVKYLYKKEGKSVLDPLYHVIWDWLETKMSDKIAPTVITCIGMVCNVLPTAILLYYSPDATSQVPSWAYFLCSLGVFVYMTMDTLDGKQCRRTDNDTALEEFFDHGFDSLSTVLITLGTCIAMKLGNQPEMMAVMAIISFVTFYMAHWQCYSSGVVQCLRLDVAEANTVVMITHIITGIYGEEIWELQVGQIGTVKMIAVYIVLFGAVFQSCIQFRHLVRGGFKSHCGLNTLYPTFPISVVLLLAVGIWWNSPANIVQQHPCLYVLAIGFLTATITASMVVSCITQDKLEFPLALLGGPALLIFSQFRNDVLSELAALYICCVMNLTCFVWFFIRNSIEMCEALNKYHFTITSRPRPLVHHDNRNNKTNGYINNSKKDTKKST